MCQVDEEYNGLENIQEKTPVPTLNKKCVKCKEETAVLIIRVSDAFCRSCFKEYFIHKFRAMLGKNRVIFPQEKVLLAVSGGSASCAMLSQVQEGLSRDAPKKLRFVPGIIYIDEGGACGLSSDERQRSVTQLKKIFTETGFPYFIVCLEQVFSLPTSVLVPRTSDPDRSDASYKEAVDEFIREKQEVTSGVDQLGLDDSACSPEHTLSLHRLFSSIQTLTAKEDMLHTLRQHLILHTARVNGYSKVMMGDSCSRLAVKLLGNMALGRGAALASDTGFSDARYGDVVIVRPMRDYSSKEIVFYSRMFHVPSVFIPSLDTKTPNKASMQRLTESFVTNLQSDFPSTVSTIYRTSEKLHTALPQQSQEPASKCLLCLCAIDTNVDEASAFHATLVSERLSRIKPQESSDGLNAARCCGEGQGCVSTGSCSYNRSLLYEDLKTLLCYSCRLTVKDVEVVNTLPPYITTEAEKRETRSRMKMQISEYLLDDDDDEE
ncbi:cytoplasmic tRNA 2-thiolation protein 2 [Triplophysa rosa]|uniref:Cytoplasmic tRNA 2-thiolation protein 2 n=1 Tax=Triplophysa rosa TaxID=992332 RepID=A0A9W7X406_TRIRA|nr:cytoplasmic tRNA 2-thiolation protein 2 [Triplophysa rosa]KAI7814232.1 Cytoplasmic tRNA 2-thiolation protein 2 [Triplophysa rosa]